MTSAVALVATAIAGIALVVILVLRGRFHPFLALLCGAFAVGLLSGLPVDKTAAAVGKGAGDILGGTGLVVALGLSLGAMLHLSGGAEALAGWALGKSGRRGAPWASLATALVLGLPLFFETGLVLLLPIVAAGAASLTAECEGEGATRLRLALPALCGLSVVHALVPPHPGPLLAVSALHANLARTMMFGIVVAIPVAILAGPILSAVTARGVVAGDTPLAVRTADRVAPPPIANALVVVLAPVVLIGLGQASSLSPALGWLAGASNPVFALLLANLVALPLLFGRRMIRAETQDALWREAMAPAGTILLSIGGGGALKQVLVSAGLADLLAKVAAAGALPPILLGWLVAVAIRLATGSATVATITAAGIMGGVVATTGASPEWTVLAIGAGSVFFSHVNDPGFWLVKSYLGTGTADTFRTWSVLETAVSVLGLLFVLAGSRLL